MNSHVLTGAIYNLPFDLLKDFEPVALLASNPSVVVSKKDVPARDLKELIAWVKPTRIRFWWERPASAPPPTSAASCSRT
jgi:tripartite-type tricarboxylate transporter receptor subunit TctC